jgi:hypothetical protein
MENKDTASAPFVPKQIAKGVKPKFADLVILKWLAEGQGNRLVAAVSTLGGTRSVEYFETVPGAAEFNALSPAGLDRLDWRQFLFGKGKIDLYGLAFEGFAWYVSRDGYPVNTDRSLDDVKSDKSFAGGALANFRQVSSRIYSIAGITSAGAQWWEAVGSALFEKLLAAKRAKQASVERRVVFGKTLPLPVNIPARLAEQLPDGYRIEIPRQSVKRPCVHAVVVRETEKRLYVRDVVEFSKDIYTRGMVISDGNEHWIDREYVMVDGVGLSGVAKLAEFDREFASEYDDVVSRFVEQVIPLVRQMSDRNLQNGVRHEEMLGDLLAEIADDKADT